MKYPIRGWFRSVLAVVVCLAMAFCLACCDIPSIGGPPSGGGNEADPPKEQTSITEDDFLRAEGELVKNRRGETVYLRGVNAGGLFVTENWMNGFSTLKATEEYPAVRDFKTISQVLIKRFGPEKAQALWKAYQEDWWSEIDFANCAAMGMNCIRLPFTYMTVDFDAVESYDNAGDYDFTPLDKFIDKAASYGMYTILDLHGAYGSQNGQDHSGETMDSVSQVDFYSNPRMIGLTADLWAALAEHYKDDPAVAGYDILNEPGEKAGTTEKRHFDVFDTLYDAIRGKDTGHLVIFESCWEGENLPHPSEYGWENCMYSFHHYTNLAEGGQYTEHGVSWNDKIANVTKMNFGVPLQMGEFNNYNDQEQWIYVLDLLNRSNWHWESWTYKINNTWDNSAWGIYTIPAVNKVNVHTDSYETILEKFSGLKTTGNIHKVDLDGRTLESVMKEYASAPVQNPLASGGYVLYDSMTRLALMGDGSKLYLANDPNAGQRFTVTPHSSGDGSVLISAASGRYWNVVGNDVLLGTKTDASARFYPVETEYGYAFISYTTCRYLRLDDGGALHPDGKVLDASAIFQCQR